LSEVNTGVDKWVARAEGGKIASRDIPELIITLEPARPARVLTIAPCGGSSFLRLDECQASMKLGAGHIFLSEYGLSKGT